MKRLAVPAVVFAVVAAGFAVYPKANNWMERHRQMAEQEQVDRPPVETVSSSPRPASSAAPAPSSLSSVASSSSAAPALRASVNWDVPFTPQAPTGVWDADHKEACEEASVLMVLRYFEGTMFKSVADADSQVIALVRANEDLGYDIDITAAQVIDLIRSQNASLKAELLKEPTEASLKKVLSEGALVIVPAQGQWLGNPYFTAPGPRYHMLVLRGYTENGYVITNDPGTKRGEQYVYRWETLLNAIHDWNGGDVETGAKVVVVVRK
jgi:hypothetical protein